MAYTPPVWHDSPQTDTPITAARLTAMDNVLAASITAASGTPPRIWFRTAAQGFPTAGDGAMDGDYLFMDSS